jgi:hypothetical protein
MQGVKTNFSIKDCSNLTKQSLLDIFNKLEPVTDLTTLTLGELNHAKLSAEEIAIVTNKGWTVMI